MKKTLQFIFICVLATFSTATAQYVTVDFESGGLGAGWTWVMDQNASNPPLTFPANPVSGGINTSATVAEFQALAAGQPWALTYSDDVDGFTLDATNSIFKIMVYKTVISDVAIKIEGAPGVSAEIKVPNTVTNQWEELTYDFSAHIGNSYNRLVVIPDFVDPGPRPADNTIYFDNIQIPQGSTCPPEPVPTVAAPTPTHDETADNVISVYSDAYTDIAGTDFNPFWGQNTVVTYPMIAGNNTLKYSNLNYQGTDFAGNPQNVSGNEFLHVDFWTPDATQLDFYLISQTTGEQAYSMTITQNQWVSVDIPLSHYSGLNLGLTDIHQFKVVGTGPCYGVVYFDNFYFHGTPPPPACPMPTIAAPTPTHDETLDNVLSVYSDAYTDITGVNFDPFWGQATDATLEMVAGNNTIKYDNLDYQGTDFVGNPQDVSGHGYIHLDFWTPDALTLDFYLISATTGEQAFSLTITQSQWVSVDIPLHHFVGLGLGLTDIHQFKVVGSGNCSGLVYFDNWYFHGTYFNPAPTTAPPTPDDLCVTSIFSDEYTDITGINYNPNWGQSTLVSNEMIAGNNTMKYTGLNYQGTDFSGNPQDVSGYDFLHVDFWTDNSTDLGIFLISPGNEIEYLLPITTGQWVSVDIPLSYFTPAVDLTNAFQLKIDGNGTIWFDNIYFHSNGEVTMPPAGTPTTITCTLACEDDENWSYYEDPSNPGDYLFAIEWDPNSTGNNAAAKTGAQVVIDVDASATMVTDGTETTWSMARYWNVTPGAALVDPVNVKFFYTLGEWNSIYFPANNSGMFEGIKWFKTTGVAFDPSLHITAAEVIGDPIELIDVNAGPGLTENGNRYAQFDGITSFSGGTAASGAGPDSSPLPVELVAFEARALDNNTVLLNWSTASEINNDYFEVEHSVNGIDFEYLTTVDGVGNSTTIQSYEAKHSLPVEGVNYYRLKQVDFDGTSAYSEVVSAIIKGSDLEFSIFPNPAKNGVNIKFQNETKDGNIQLYNVDGKLMMNQTLDQGILQQSIIVDDMVKGIYWLRIENQGQIGYQKLVIQ